MSVNPKKIRYNQSIRAKEVRVIGEDGSQAGVVSLEDALKLAEEAELDLVEISPNTNPPVCKIMDYGKYCYSILKKEKDNRKKQKNVIVKEVKFTSKIEEHDYQTKLKQCEKFLNKGDKVKVTMIFRGRERSHTDIGREVLTRLFEDLTEIGTIEKDYGFKGNNIVTVLTPKV